MGAKIIIDEHVLDSIFTQESKVLVGKVCKRFELSTDLEAIKKAVKELLYESMRDTHRMITYVGKESVKLTKVEQK